MAVDGDVDVREPEQGRQTWRPAHRPTRGRIWRRRAGVVVVVALAWLAWSIGGALTAPGTDTTAARLAEWGRSHGLGLAVTYLEQLQYQVNPPKVGGSPAGGIPHLSPNGSVAPQSRPATYLPPPSRIVAMSFCEPRSCRLQLSS